MEGEPAITQRHSQPAKSLMEHINKVYQSEFSPRSVPNHNRSIHSKSNLILIDKSRSKNNSVMKPHTLDQNLPTIPSKYQRIVKEGAYHNKSSPKLVKSYINASYAKLKQNPIPQNTNELDDSVVSHLFMFY